MNLVLLYKHLGGNKKQLLYQRPGPDQEDLRPKTGLPVQDQQEPSLE